MYRRISAIGVICEMPEISAPLNVTAALIASNQRRCLKRAACNALARMAVTRGYLNVARNAYIECHHLVSARKQPLRKQPPAP